MEFFLHEAMSVAGRMQCAAEAALSLVTTVLLALSSMVATSKS